MSPEELAAPRTRSEHDPSKTWSYADHFIHTTLIERNWNGMFSRHVSGEVGLARRLHIMAANADHAVMHLKWADEAPALG